MKSNIMKNVLIAALLVFITHTASAGFFSDVSKYLKERSEIKTHSNSIISGIKELYRDRKTISNLALSSSQLIAAYKEIRNGKTNIPALLNIAKNIDNVVRGYQSIQPVATRVYNKIEPDLAYFSKLKGNEGNYALPIGGNQLKIESLSDAQIGKFSGTAGWGRVFETIKENPLNIFKWGKLKDEYTYGKAQAGYVLKGVQMAFEAKSFYDHAKNQLDNLMNIRSQINGLLSGNLDALLGMGTTINNIQSAAGGVEDLGALLNSAVDHVGKRFDELQTASQNYVAIHQNYAKKYQGEGVTATVSQGNSQPTTTKKVTSSSSQQAAANKNLKKAMDLYQQAYKQYVAIAQNPNATAAERNAAIQDLNYARNEYETLKAASGK